MERASRSYLRWIDRFDARTPQSSIDREAYNLLPEFLTVRETRVRVEQPGLPSRTLIIATTLLDAEDVTKRDSANLYRARWNAELVRKEIWTHILADICGGRFIE